MKKIIYKLRIWLIKKLNAVPAEDFKAIDAANNILAAKVVDGNKSTLQLVRRYFMLTSATSSAAAILFRPKPAMTSLMKRLKKHGGSGARRETAT